MIDGEASSPSAQSTDKAIEMVIRLDATDIGGEVEEEEGGEEEGKREEISSSNIEEERTEKRHLHPTKEDSANKKIKVDDDVNLYDDEDISFSA